MRIVQVSDASVQEDKLPLGTDKQPANQGSGKLSALSGQPPAVRLPPTLNTQRLSAHGCLLTAFPRLLFAARGHANHVLLAPGDEERAAGFAVTTHGNGSEGAGEVAPDPGGATFGGQCVWR